METKLINYIGEVQKEYDEFQKKGKFSYNNISKLKELQQKIEGLKWILSLNNRLPQPIDL